MKKIRKRNAPGIERDASSNPSPETPVAERPGGADGAASIGQ